jgi:hypothetical protein
MLGEATLDALGTFLGEAIRFPIQIAALQLTPSNDQIQAFFCPGGAPPLRPSLEAANTGGAHRVFAGRRRFRPLS